MYKYRDTQPISEDPITRTGSTVTIDNPDDVLALHNLVADINPIQSLNGYDKPWSGGNGVNLLPPAPAKTTTMGGMTYTSDGNGKFTVSGTKTDTSAYIDIELDNAVTMPTGNIYVHLLNNFATSQVAFVFFNGKTQLGYVPLTTTNRIVDASSWLSGATFDKVRVFTNDARTYNGSFTPMVCTTNTVIPFEPYSNICPISGHDEVGVSVTDEQKYNFSNVVIGKNWIGGNDVTRATLTFDVEPSTRYRVITEGGNFSAILFIRMDNFIQITNVVINPPFNGYITTESNCNKVIVQFQKDTAITESDFDDFECSISKEYETYTTDLGRTVYGGTLDVVSGVLTVDREYIQLNANEWSLETISGHQCFQSRASGNRASSGYPSGICNAFTVVNSYSAVGNNNSSIGINTARTLIRCDSFLSVDDLVSFINTNGIALCVELATPTTVQLTAQEVELLVGLNQVWANSGDVSVTYAVDLDRYVIKPAEAVSINGKYLEDIVKGYRTLYVKGRESLAVDLDTYSVGTSNGEKIKGSKYPARTLTIGFQLLCDTNEEFRQRFNQLNNILSIGEADFVFNDERDKFFTGYPIMDAEVEEGRNNVTGEWTLYCAYPFKRSVQPITLTSTDAVIEGNSATFTFNYDGVMPAKPVLRAEFASAKVGGDYSEDGDCGYVAFLNQDESIIQLGNPDVLDVDADNKNDTLINTAFDVLTNWTASGITLANITDPYWNKGAGQTMKFARGIGTLTRSIANTINFEFDIVQRLCVSSPTQAGTFKALLKNGNRIIVGYIIEKTGSGTTANVKYILNDIVVGADTIDVSYYNTNFGYCNRTPVYVTQDTYTLVREIKHDLKRHRTIGVFRPVKTGTRQVQDGWNYTQSNLNSGISRSGSVVTFSVGNLPDRTFKSSDIEATPCSNVTFETTGTFNTNAIRSACLVKKAGVPFADIPNVFTAGDIVEADCNSADVFLYRAGSVDGHLEPQYGALGNDWETFEIKVGQNIIRAVWSEWVNTNYKPVVKIIFNKVYI